MQKTFKKTDNIVVADDILNALGLSLKQDVIKVLARHNIDLEPAASVPVSNGYKHIFMRREFDAAMAEYKARMEEESRKEKVVKESYRRVPPNNRGKKYSTIGKKVEAVKGTVDNVSKEVTVLRANVDMAMREIGELNQKLDKLMQLWSQ